MAAELTQLECVTIAANINAETVVEQQREIRMLEAQVIRLRINLQSIYDHGTHLPGRESVQALLDAGYLTAEDVK